jgi:hypothetical protein
MKQKWAGGVAHVEECLPSKLEALDSNPRITNSTINKKH